MKTALLLFFYLLCCKATESLTDQLVILGQNVTVHCDVDDREVYWLFQKPSDSLVVILRTFSSESTSALYNDQRFKIKYSSQTNSSLFISSITTDELGIYYCVKPGIPAALQLSTGIRLYTAEPAPQNQTEQNDPEEHMQSVTVASISLNAVLLFIVIALLLLKCKKPRKGPKPEETSQNVEAVPCEDVSTAQYSEIELSTYTRESEPCQINATYALLQKPKPNGRRAQT